MIISVQGSLIDTTNIYTITPVYGSQDSYYFIVKFFQNKELVSRKLSGYDIYVKETGKHYGFIDLPKEKRNEYSFRAKSAMESLREKVAEQWGLDPSKLVSLDIIF